MILDAIILVPVVVDTGKLDESHQDHKPHVGLKLLYSNLGPRGEPLSSHTLKSELVTLVDDECQESWGEEQRKDTQWGGRDGNTRMSSPSEW